MSTKKPLLRNLTPNQFVELTGMNIRTIKKRLANLDPVEEDGRSRWYDSHEALPLIFSDDHESGFSAHGDDEDGQKIDMRFQIARRIKLQADHLEIDLKKKRGEVVDREEFLEEYKKLIWNFRSRCLSLPNLAGEIRAAVSDREGIEILRKGIYEALNELKSYDARSDREIINDGASEFSGSTVGSSDQSMG